MGDQKLSPAKPRIVTIPSLPFEENSYVAYFEGEEQCLIVDPGMEPDKIVDCLRQHRLTPAAIWCTHGHYDHIAGNAYLKGDWPKCPLLIGAGDEPKLSDAWQNLSGQFGFPMTSPPADQLVHEGERLSVAGFEFLVREIPGHSSGHVVFIWESGRPIIVFGGDVLFRGSIGRYDFPDGSFEQLEAGIHEKLFTLPDDTIVLPGHGPATTIGEEKRSNPAVGAPAGYRG
jgi:glyoxylase-like metal-dependent hydrolase (beta-lactamase superfamily II)